MDTAAKPYGSLDPNSAHQIWSRWTFGIHADATRRPRVAEVVDNARRYFTKLLGSTVGRVRCDEQDGYYVLILEIEGVPAHDVDLQDAVQRDVEQRFVKKGFGSKALLSRFVVGILSGDQQNGQPPDQLLVTPRMFVTTTLHGV